MNFFARLISRLRELFPNCRTAVRVQSDAMDRPLNWTQRLGLTMHRLVCRWCRRYGQQILFLRTAARQRDEKTNETLPEKLSPESRERIKRRLTEEQ